MFSRSQFLITLLVIIIIGVLYTGYSFINYINLKSSDEYLSQIEEINNKIRKTRMQINYIKRKYKKNDNKTTLEYYMNLIKQFKYIIKGSEEISDFSISFIQHDRRSKRRKGKKIKNNLLLLSDYLQKYNKNKYLKSLDLILSFKISNNKNIDLNEKTINFFKIYKPLLYVYYLKQNKPIKIKNIKYFNNYYNIYIQIIGK